jgi:hypothetical protein
MPKKMWMGIYGFKLKKIGKEFTFCRILGEDHPRSDTNYHEGELAGKSLKKGKRK